MADWTLYKYLVISILTWEKFLYEKLYEKKTLDGDRLLFFHLFDVEMEIGLLCFWYITTGIFL